MTENQKTSKIKVSKKYKKPVIASAFISVIALAGIIGGFLIFLRLPESPEFICGMNDTPNSIDPLKNPTPKYVNLMIIDQVAEGLFDYDQNNVSTPIVPNLALEGTWSPDNLNYTCTLRRNVKFHDGMPFNATAVKWNFDRIHRFIYTMPSSDTWVWTYLFLNPKGEQYINRTEVIDEFTVRFVMNQPYAPLKHLLVLWNTYILSPTSTPEDQFIDLETEKIVGTGPFVYDSSELNQLKESIKTELHANHEYWGDKPFYEKLTFLDLNYTQRYEKMISGELSYVMRDMERLEDYRFSPEVNVVSKQSLGFWYIPMNNKLVNETMRKAISYAYNYTEFIETIHGEHAERLKSPLPRLMHYANWEDLDMPYYNVSMARQILKDANWPNTTSLTANDDISPGNEWELLANSLYPLSTHNFSVVSGTYHQPISANIMKENLKQIGVKLNIINMSGAEWWTKMKAGELEVFIAGWNAAFLDPIELINPIYSNGIDGLANVFHFNDTITQGWIEQAIAETDENTREQLYFDIQQRLIDLNPVVWLDSPINYHIWNSDVKGIPTNGAIIKFILKNTYFS